MGTLLGDGPDTEVYRRVAKEEGVSDRVFMTGGSSFVPAVRRIFETRFGADRLRGGGEFVSVARGLAMHGHLAR